MKTLNKVLDFISNNKIIIMVIFLSTFSIMYIFNENNVTPFGDKSLLCIDFFHQYGPMMYEYWYRLHGGGGFIYSFFQGLGLPFFRNFMNYLSSPFNFLMLFFNKDGLLKSISLIIGLKAVASSTTMAYYLKNKFKDNSYYFVPIALLYGFSAYYRSYYWNLMWIDGMIWLPLVALGIENIVNNRKWKLYTFSLAILLISNYFVGYMTCIFSCIYFLLYFIYKANFKGLKFRERIKEIFKSFGMFAGCSLLGGSLFAFLLIPMASALLSTSATGSSMPTSQYYAFELIDFLKTHLSCVANVTFASDPINSPNISAGIISVFFFIAYISNINIPRKNKFCYLALYGSCLLMFFVPQIDFIMHAFHVPNDLPYRYSFIYTFVFLVMGAYGAHNIDKESFLKLLGVFVFTLGIILVCLLEPWENTSNNMLYINIILLTLLFLFITLGRFFKVYETIFLAALSLVATIDVIESTNYAWDITQVEENFVQTTIEIDEVKHYIDKIDDSKFYRMDELSYHTLSDSSKSFYNGMTSFSSMAYEDMAKLQINLGMPGNTINSYSYIEQTPIYDIMFDMKYIIGKPNDNVRYEVINGNTIKEFYRFNYTAGLAFGVDKEITKWNYSDKDPIKNQIDFIQKSTGMSYVLPESYPLYKNELNETAFKTINYTYNNTGDNYYLTWNDSAISFVIIGDTLYGADDGYNRINNLAYSTFEGFNLGEIINIKSEDPMLNITVGYNYLDEEAFHLYSINHELFLKFHKKLSNNSLNITAFNESYIKGTIKVDKNQVVYTSIPYDKGWNVYVDGKKSETFSLANSLLAFNCDDGEHEIIIKYTIPYIIPGMFISLCSLLTIIFCIVNKDNKLFVKMFNGKKKHKKRSKRKS